MSINYCRLSVLASLIVVNAMSLVAHAGDVWIKTHDGKESMAVPLDIAKKIPTINHLIEDLGSADNAKDTPIPLHNVDDMTFTSIIDMLKHEDKEPGIIDNILLSYPTNRLLVILEAASYLDVRAIVDASVKSFILSSLDAPSGFHYLTYDIKKLILMKLTPRQFMSLIKANRQHVPTAQAIKQEEESFIAALAIHYQEEPVGVTAQERYNELHRLGGFVYIPGGTYDIGSPTTEADRNPNENLHPITLSPFFIMDAAVTQESYARVTGTNPSSFKEKKYCPESYEEIEVNGVKIPVCADHPVEMVSYDDAQSYAKLLSDQDAKYTYRLPTEAQLEVAFRGGTKTAYVTGRDDEVGLGDYVWCAANSNSQTHGVKSKLANALDINRSSVFEWTADYYDEDYSGSTGLDPKGPASGSARVIRGGSWCDRALCCRSAIRNDDRPHRRRWYLGFRLVRTKK